MIRLRHALTVAGAAALLVPACVVPLKDRNAPLENGGVTGPAADCSAVTPLGTGGPAGEAAIDYVGRFDTTNPEQPAFDWAGNQIRIRFDGATATVGFLAYNTIWFTAVLDDLPPRRFPVLEGKFDYPMVGDSPDALFGPVAPGPHELVIHRDSESIFGVTTFRGVDLAGGTLLPPTRFLRRIEIIGDSITCGYGNLGANATCPFASETENNYLAYGSVAGRSLSAEVNTLCWSGKGVVLNYRERADDPDSTTTMPQLWQERTLAGIPTGPKWDLTKDVPENQPHAVVIHLGTNDITRDIDLDNVADGLDFGRFRQGFFDFVVEVRRVRPDAHIFIALPPMISDQFPFENARSDTRNVFRGIADEFQARGDAKVYFLELVEQGTRYGLGCDYHPNLTVHRIMADQIVGAIRQKTCW